jgi:hypothetical protein
LVPHLRSADADARLIPELTVGTNEDAKVTKDDFAGADSFTGFVHHVDGGIELSPTVATLIEGATVAEVDAFQTDLNLTSPHLVSVVEWGGSEDSNIVVERIVAYLHPQENGGNPKTVSKWVAQLYAVTEILDSGIHLLLAPLTSPVSVDAPGSSASDITFDFSGAGQKPRPKEFGPPRLPLGGTQDPPAVSTDAPVTILFIWAMQSDDTVADNVGWGFDTGVTDKTSSGNRITHATLSEQGDGSYAHLGETTGLQRVKYDTGSFTAATISWTTNPLDLGAAPTGSVELFGRAATPPGTSVTLRIRNDGDTAWVDYTDGQTFAELGLSATQTRKVQATLTPNTAGDVTPRLLELGMREITIYDLSRIATLEGPVETLDPFTLQAEIAQATLRAIHEGEPDYEDLIRRLLSENDLKQLSVRAFWGHDDLNRKDWLLRGRFLVNETAGLGAHAELTLVSPLVKLRVPLPKPTGTPVTRSPYVRTNVTPKAEFENLVDNIAALPQRFRGPGIEETSFTISKTVTDSRVKPEADAVAFIAGGAIGGVDRVTFLPVFGQKSPVAIFPSSEIRQGTITPGWSRRMPEVFLRHNWDFAANEHGAETRSIDQPGIDAVDPALLDPPKWIDDRIGQWVDSQAVANALTNRTAEAFTLGEILIDWESQYRYSELQLGDAVLVATDRLAARDPIGARALRGRRWVLAVLVGIGGSEGRQFKGWVRSFSDVLSNAEVVDFVPTVSDVVSAGYALFVPLDPSVQWTLKNEWAEPTTLATDEEEVMHLTRRELPQGTRINALRGRYYLGDASTGSAEFQMQLLKAGIDGGSRTVHGTFVNLTETNAWQTSSAVGSLPITVDWENNHYFIQVRLKASGVLANARFMWCEMDVDRPRLG